jgi:hypothetical protein
VFSASFRSSPPVWSGLWNSDIRVDSAETDFGDHHDPPPENRPILQIKSSLLI